MISRVHVYIPASPLPPRRAAQCAREEERARASTGGSERAGLIARSRAAVPSRAVMRAVDEGVAGMGMNRKARDFPRKSNNAWNIPNLHSISIRNPDSRETFQRTSGFHVTEGNDSYKNELLRTLYREYVTFDDAIPSRRIPSRDIRWRSPSSSVSRVSPFDFFFVPSRSQNSSPRAARAE